MLTVSLKELFKKLMTKQITVEQRDLQTTKNAYQGKINFKRSNIETDNTGETLLDIAENQKILLPFSCRQGMCGTCMQIKISGDIHEDKYDDEILTEEEKNQGYILLCQARAKGDVTIDV